MRAQFGRPGEQRGEHIELVGARGAGAARGRSTVRRRRSPPARPDGARPLYGVGLPVPVPAQYVQLGAQPSGLRREQVGRLRDDQPAERRRRIKAIRAVSNRVGPVTGSGRLGFGSRTAGHEIQTSRPRSSAQPPATGRPRGTGREEQRRGIARHADARERPRACHGPWPGRSPQAGKPPPPGAGLRPEERPRPGEWPEQRHRPEGRRWLPRDRPPAGIGCTARTARTHRRDQFQRGAVASRQPADHDAPACRHGGQGGWQHGGEVTVRRRGGIRRGHGEDVPPRAGQAVMYRHT